MLGFRGRPSWCECINVSSRSSTKVFRCTKPSRCRDTGMKAGKIFPSSHRSRQLKAFVQLTWRQGIQIVLHRLILQDLSELFVAEIRKKDPQFVQQLKNPSKTHNRKFGHLIPLSTKLKITFTRLKHCLILLMLHLIWRRRFFSLALERNLEIFLSNVSKILFEGVLCCSE